MNTSSYTANNCGYKYLVQLSRLNDKKFQDFIHPEIESVYEMICDKKPEFSYDYKEIPHDDALILANFPSINNAQEFANRSITVRCVIELLGLGSTYSELFESLKQYCNDNYHTKQYTFSLKRESINRKMDQQTTLWLFDAVKFLHFLGKADLKHPQYTFWFIVDFYPIESTSDELRLRGVYFGREIARNGGRSKVFNQFSLKTRLAIGPTSTDSELAFIMVNQAQVQKHHIVCDPFAGSGSLLVGAKSIGAFTFGADINWKLLRPGIAGIGTSFDQYNFSKPELIRCDFSRFPLRILPIFHSIITDPPFGLRASSRKVGARGRIQKALDAGQTVELKEGHYSQMVSYPLNELLSDLFRFAALRLIPKGRLVMLYPTMDDYQDSDLFIHPCLKLLYNSEQKLHGRLRRRLLTYQRICNNECNHEWKPVLFDKPANYDLRNSIYQHNNK